jgi:myo-inositol-1(or 4)-monophosphatase
MMKETAVLAAKEAARIIKKHLGKISQTNIDLKRKFDYVTQADRESEQKIIEVIRARYPDHKFYAEESIKDGPGGYRWLIDPLDGTTNYIHAYPIYSVSIALEHDGEVILGVVYDPTRDEMFIAEKGKGATLNGEPIKVSSIDDPAMSLVLTGFPFRSKKMVDLYLSSFKKIFARVSDIRRDGSAALDFCAIACGRADAFWEIGLSPWDVAAGYLMITEAGGRMTDFFGKKNPLWTGNVVASNGALHPWILADVQETFAGHIDG